jgi:cytochrome bd-type quinol oxidase subunit 2
VTGWDLVRWLHLLAMAFFVGGQLVLVAAVLPALRSDADRTRLRAIARRFGVGSLVALVVLIATGSALAGHLDRWADGALHLKLALVAVAGALIGWHIRRPGRHWIEGLVFVVSLAIVWLGVSLAH